MANSFTRPPRVVGGNKQAISAKDFNALSRGIEELQNTISPQSSKTNRRIGARIGCIPWSPTFTSSGGVNYVTFSLGLVNQVAAGNWDTPLAIGASDTKWPVLDITASNGQITGVTIALDSAPPSADTVQENTPPGSFKIVLGVIDSLSACMAVAENLEAVATEVFRKSRAAPGTGEEPFTRVWRWKVSQNSSGDYPYIT